MSATPTPEQLRAVADALEALNALSACNYHLPASLMDMVKAHFETGEWVMVLLAERHGNLTLRRAVALTLRLEAQRIEELAEHPLAANREVICDECDGMIAKIVRDSWEAKT